MSLFVCTYNRADAFGATLSSVLSQLPDEIVIADDGLGEETKKLIEAYKKKLYLFYIVGIMIRAFIRNKAMAMANSQYILLIDGDIVMHRHFIRSHKRKAKKIK